MAFQPQATRSLRRIRVRTPGNRLVTHFEKRNPSISKCGSCGQELKGIPRERPAKFRNLPYSQKTVARPYGGNLCSKCSREKIIEKFKDIKELPLEIGQVCVKTAGKEAGSICVIVDKLDENFVLIDGNVKRRKCNVLHLKTLDKKIDIKKNDSAETIKRELKAFGFEIKEKKKKEKKIPEKKEEGKELKKPEKVAEKKEDKKGPKIKTEKPKKVKEVKKSTGAKK